jgi:hypothetical protein
LYLVIFELFLLFPCYTRSLICYTRFPLLYKKQEVSFIIREVCFILILVLVFLLPWFLLVISFTFNLVLLFLLVLGMSTFSRRDETSLYSLFCDFYPNLFLDLLKLLHIALTLVFWTCTLKKRPFL